MYDKPTLLQENTHVSTNTIGARFAMFYDKKYTVAECNQKCMQNVDCVEFHLGQPGYHYDGRCDLFNSDQLEYEQIHDFDVYRPADNGAFHTHVYYIKMDSECS